MPVNAIFSIASMTKPVTSVAIMMLFEEGKLKLDDPVSKYLPGFDNLQVITKFNEKDATYETRPAKRPMTIRHLLTHTSGIAYGVFEPDRVPAQRGDEKGRVGAAAPERSRRQMELRPQHARARHDRRENHRRAARSLVPAAHLRAARHGGYVVRRAARQTVARGHEAQPRKRPVAGTAAATHPGDADAPVPRRWRPLLHRAGLRKVHARCCSTEGIWGPRKS